MVEIGIAEYFDIGAALGIIGTMFVVLYYSRKQAQGLSKDIEKDSKRLGREGSQDVRDHNRKAIDAKSHI